MVKQIALVVFALSVLGGSCASMGCSYTIKHTGTTTHKAQVAGVGEECIEGEEGEECKEIAALSAEMQFKDYTLTLKGDPLALGLRVVNDVKTFIGSLFAARAPRTTVGT